MSGAKVRLTQIAFQRFKALNDFSVSLHDVNLLVGPNNSGKSTIISALKVLDSGIRFAKNRAPTKVFVDDEAIIAYRIPEASVPISLENVHTNYDSADSKVTFTLSNKNKISLIFPGDGGCVLVPEVAYQNVLTASQFKKEFPISLTIVPTLGPLEHKEARREKNTVVDGLSTHRAARHFRNYWYYFGDGFEDFAELVKTSWPGMEIRAPEFDIHSNEISMFCLEGRLTRELFWVGFGFQIWCQLLTHLSRAKDSSLIVVDEPEIYLHPDVQRQLLGIVRDIGSPVLMATHSGEIMTEAEPSDIVLIDKAKRTGERLKDVSAVQRSLNLIGSAQNITLTALARNRRVLFVEGDYDFKVIRRFARKFGLAELGAGIGLTSLESGGFGSWQRITTLAAGIAEVLGSPIKIAAIYDRDYFCQEEIDFVTESLSISLELAHVHAEKEIENYLLLPVVLERAVKRAMTSKDGQRAEMLGNINVHQILLDITAPLKDSVQAQVISKRLVFLRTSGRDGADITAETIKAFNQGWDQLDGRLKVVSGKEVLARLSVHPGTNRVF